MVFYWFCLHQKSTLETTKLFSPIIIAFLPFCTFLLKRLFIGKVLLYILVQWFPNFLSLQTKTHRKTLWLTIKSLKNYSVNHKIENFQHYVHFQCFIGLKMVLYLFSRGPNLKFLQTKIGPWTGLLETLYWSFDGIFFNTKNLFFLICLHQKHRLLNYN